VRGLLHGLQLSAKERSLVLQLSDGKVCPLTVIQRGADKGLRWWRTAIRRSCAAVLLSVGYAD
jgi:hypothetical protein